MDPKNTTTNEELIDSSTNDTTVEDFEHLREELLKPRLYEDPDFPADVSSLCYTEGFLTKLESIKGEIEWKRPKEICADPKFSSDGLTRFDVVQGSLGNCWFPAALAPLTLNNKVLHNVVPKGQSFDEKYAGIFHFRFWRFGHWVTVMVDDRLPTSYKKEEGTHELVFMKSSQSSEFWTALIEKAYAKMHGSYEALAGGWTGEALEDFTGGVMEQFLTENFKPVKLFRMMLQAQKRGSLMGCALFISKEGDEEEPSSEEAGLVAKHAYSVTCVKYIKTQTSEGQVKMRMVRLRNPWGQSEWKGSWSDNSSEWKKVPEEVKEILELKHKEDGEFWIEIKDLCKHFDILEMTHLNPANDINDLTEKNWEMTQFEGKWEMGVSDGGCTHFSDTFHMNPQYRITLHEHDEVLEGDEDDDDEEDSTADGGHKCTVIVSLTQKNRRLLHKNEYLMNGFSIFKIPDPSNTPDRLKKSFFEENKEVACSPYNIIPSRTSTKRFHLSPGTYCVVPTSFPGEEGEFLLRIFYEKHSENIHLFS